MSSGKNFTLSSQKIFPVKTFFKSKRVQLQGSVDSMRLFFFYPASSHVCYYYFSSCWFSFPFNENFIGIGQGMSQSQLQLWNVSFERLWKRDGYFFVIQMSVLLQRVKLVVLLSFIIVFIALYFSKLSKLIVEDLSSSRDISLLVVGSLLFFFCLPLQTV